MQAIANSVDGQIWQISHSFEPLLGSPMVPLHHRPPRQKIVDMSRAVDNKTE